ncbi:MAG: class I SAM-dependent methyltransferase [Clostridia bacterium]|nr:class I SAM-dependent methyltransferase [Clostridia bacterium]
MVINALDEVLFWQDIAVIHEVIQDLTAKYHPHDPQSYFAEKKQFLQKTIPTKADFLRRLEHYAENGTPTWISGRTDYCDDLGMNALKKAIHFSTPENGEQKSAKAESVLARDPAFWTQYANEILSKDKNTVLEMTIGAGLGTTAILRQMRPADMYFGVDIDFRCAKNADALARHYQVNGLGITASLWNLPFDDNTFSTICSNQGLEECREIPTILAESVRVLQPGGKLVLHCLKTSHWVRYFTDYGFSDAEIYDWLCRLRVYAGIEQIDAILLTQSMNPITRKEDAAKGYIAVYEKI